jgi:hypothetical protein
MTPSAIPIVKRGLAAVDSRQAATVALAALRARSVDEVDALLAPLADAMHRAAVDGSMTVSEKDRL